MTMYHSIPPDGAYCIRSTMTCSACSVEIPARSKFSAWRRASFHLTNMVWISMATSLRRARVSRARTHLPASRWTAHIRSRISEADATGRRGSTGDAFWAARLREQLSFSSPSTHLLPFHSDGCHKKTPS